METINLNMTSVEVKSEVRKLQCEWTRELAKDLEVHADIDMSSFEKYIARELRKEGRKKFINKLFF